MKRHRRSLKASGTHQNTPETPITITETPQNKQPLKSPETPLEPLETPWNAPKSLTPLKPFEVRYETPLKSSGTLWKPPKTPRNAPETCLKCPETLLKPLIPPGTPTQCNAPINPQEHLWIALKPQRMPLKPLETSWNVPEPPWEALDTWRTWDLLELTRNPRECNASETHCGTPMKLPAKHLWILRHGNLVQFYYIFCNILWSFFGIPQEVWNTSDEFIFGINPHVSSWILPVPFLDEFLLIFLREFILFFLCIWFFYVIWNYSPCSFWNIFFCGSFGVPPLTFPEAPSGLPLKINPKSCIPQSASAEIPPELSLQILHNSFWRGFWGDFQVKFLVESWKRLLGRIFRWFLFVGITRMRFWSNLQIFGGITTQQNKNLW